MADVTQYFFDYKEVVEALIKKQGIHEGLWRLIVEFGFTAHNVNTPEGVLRPASTTILQRIGITQAEAPSNLAVDAAEVNPRPKAAKKASSKKRPG